MDLNANEGTSATSAQHNEMSRPSVDEVADTEAEAMTLPDYEIGGCFRDDGSLEEGTLGLEQLFAVTQHELKKIQDLLMLEKDGDTTLLGLAEVEVEGDSDTETEPLSVFLNGNWKSTSK
jgi:hypothetical protein